MTMRAVNHNDNVSVQAVVVSVQLGTDGWLEVEFSFYFNENILVLSIFFT